MLTQRSRFARPQVCHYINSLQQKLHSDAQGHWSLGTHSTFDEFST